MKLYQRQLLAILSLFLAIFGLTVYFVFKSLNAAIDSSSKTSAILLTSYVQDIVLSGLDGVEFHDKLPPDHDSRLRQLLLKELNKFDCVENVFLLNRLGKIIFSLKPGAIDFYPTQSLPAETGTGNFATAKVIQRSGAGACDAVWMVEPAANLLGVVRINPKAGRIRAILQDLDIKLYLLGFAGVLGAIFLSFIGTRVSRSALANISKALDVIDKRKYGFRLKWKADDEFANTYQKVNEALQRMEQLDAAQRNAVQKRNSVINELKTTSRFLDIMAHEIKNPLHALGINLDVLKSKIQKSQPQESTLKHVEILEHELDHLQEVVQGFLSYVRPGVPKRERAPVNEIIRQVCQMVSANAEKAKLRIETRLAKNLRDILVDRGQLQQALHNVVINAIHATAAGGKIIIRSWAKRNRILIAIKDSGTGISKEQIKKIFDLYYTTKKDGTGLGLPVSKRIVEANGGELQLESAVGKGTTVTLLFPAM